MTLQEEAEVEENIARDLRFALKRRGTHRPSLKAPSAVQDPRSSKTDVAAAERGSSPVGGYSPGRGSPGAVPHMGGLRIVPLSAPPKRTSTTETATRRVIDAAFLTWNVNGHAISREDARAWAQAAGPLLTPTLTLTLTPTPTLTLTLILPLALILTLTRRHCRFQGRCVAQARGAAWRR